MNRGAQNFIFSKTINLSFVSTNAKLILVTLEYKEIGIAFYRTISVLVNLTKIFK